MFEGLKQRGVDLVTAFEGLKETVAGLDSMFEGLCADILFGLRDGRGTNCSEAPGDGGKEPARAAVTDLLVEERREETLDVLLESLFGFAGDDAVVESGSPVSGDGGFAGLVVGFRVGAGVVRIPILGRLGGFGGSVMAAPVGIAEGRGAAGASAVEEERTGIRHGLAPKGKASRERGLSG